MTLPRALQWWTRQRIPTATLRFRDPVSETRWLLWFGVLYIGAACVTGLLITHFPLPIWGATDFLQDFWYTVPFKVGLMLVVPMWVFWRRGYRPADFAYGWRPTPRALIVVALCFCAGVLINMGRLDELRAAWQTHSTREAMLRAALGVAIAFLQAGIPEEFVYRGLMQTRLEARWGRLLAIVVSVGLFVGWHLPTRYLLAHGVEGEAFDLGSVLLGTGVPVGIVGLCLALAWDRNRNLPALIAIHGGIDSIPIVSSMLQSTAIGHR